MSDKENYYERKFIITDELKEALKDTESEINKLLDQLFEEV